MFWFWLMAVAINVLSLGLAVMNGSVFWLTVNSAAIMFLAFTCPKIRET